MERIYPRLSQRNIEEEVLNELEKVPPFNNKGSSMATPKQQSFEIETNSYRLNTNYSRDFGRFDVTICAGDDGTQIVLVLLDGRIALNGKPIQLLTDGRVVDWCGDHDPLLQRYYDHAMKVRASRGKAKGAGGSSRPKEVKVKEGSCKPKLEPDSIETKIRESLKLMSVLGQVMLNKMQDVAESNKAKRRASNIPNHGFLSCLRRSPSVISVLDRDREVEDEEEAAKLNRIYNELFMCEHNLYKNLNTLLKCREDLERDTIALVWTVMSFCREAILRESQKFVHDKYKDLYEKYMQAVGREENLILELGNEKEKYKSLKKEIDDLKEKVMSVNGSSGKSLEDTEVGREDTLNNVIRRLKQENKALKKKLLKSNKQKESDKLRISQLERSLEIFSGQLKFKRNQDQTEDIFHEVSCQRKPEDTVQQKTRDEWGKITGNEVQTTDEQNVKTDYPM